MKIERLFGHTDEVKFIEDLQGESRYSDRLRKLTWLFMELVAQKPERMYMSFLMSKVLTGIAREELDTPAKVLNYLNGVLDDEALTDVFMSGVSASITMLGKESKTVKDLMEDFENAQKDK